MTHVLMAYVSEHTLILTVAIGNGTLQSQQLAVAKEMDPVVGCSRCEIIWYILSSINQKTRWATFEILRCHGNCVVSLIAG